MHIKDKIKNINNITDPDVRKKFKLDIWYVDNLSFGLDIKIIFSTILKVFATQGINNHNANCNLPNTLADKLNADWATAKSLCFK